MEGQNINKVKKVLWTILFANLFVAATKIFVGTIIDSSSLQADGFHSLTDGVSNIIGLVGIQIAAKPIDDDHPYGHRKYENLTGLFIGGMLFVIVGKVVVEAATRMFSPVVPQISNESLAALVMTIIINIAVSKYEYHQGETLNSYILKADALHTKSDIYISLGVLFSLISVKFGAPASIDPIASFLVAGFILHAGVEIIRSTSDILVDKAIIDTELIKNIAMQFAEVKGVHDIRSRGSEQDIYVDMHILIEPDMSVAAAHQLVHAIENAISEQFDGHVSVLIHTEPYGAKEGSGSFLY